jgi:hypothetical protein
MCNHFIKILIYTPNWQVMRMSTPLNALVFPVKERKISQSASCKIDSIVRQLFLPMLGMPTPERTSFLPEDAEDQLMRQVAQERPGALSSESEFVDYMVLLYRKFQCDLTRCEQSSNNAKERVDLVQPGTGEPPVRDPLPIQFSEGVSHLP